MLFLCCRDETTLGQDQHPARNWGWCWFRSAATTQWSTYSPNGKFNPSLRTVPINSELGQINTRQMGKWPTPAQTEQSYTPPPPRVQATGDAKAVQHSPTQSLFFKPHSWSQSMLLNNPLACHSIINNSVMMTVTDDSSTGEVLIKGLKLAFSTLLLNEC